PENENLVKSLSTKHIATAERQGNRIVLTPENIFEDKGLEFPSFNEEFRGKQYKFAYAAGTINQNNFRNKVCKVNFDTKQFLEFKEDEHVFPGEPYFLPRPNGSDEEDGVVLVPMTNTKDPHKDFLLFLDKDMTEIARATFQNDIPSAFHGIFLRD
ncbi:unnamed protein product, partial [Allacma fusca]